MNYSAAVSTDSLSSAGFSRTFLLFPLWQAHRSLCLWRLKNPCLGPFPQSIHLWGCLTLFPSLSDTSVSPGSHYGSDSFVSSAMSTDVEILRWTNTLVQQGGGSVRFDLDFDAEPEFLGLKMALG